MCFEMALQLKVTQAEKYGRTQSFGIDYKMKELELEELNVNDSVVHGSLLLKNIYLHSRWIVNVVSINSSKYS